MQTFINMTVNIIFLLNKERNTETHVHPTMLFCLRAPAGAWNGLKQHNPSLAPE
jgi:hypothetical protein